MKEGGDYSCVIFIYIYLYIFIIFFLFLPLFSSYVRVYV
jgi:hypothetical protein